MRDRNRILNLTMLAAIAMTSYALADDKAYSGQPRRLKADAPVNVKEYWLACQPIKPKAIEQAKAEVDVLKNELRQVRSGAIRPSATSFGQGRDGNWVFPSYDAKQEEVVKAEKRLADQQRVVEGLKTGDVLPSIPLGQLKIGAIGGLSAVTVKQVVDPTNMIVELGATRPIDPRARPVERPADTTVWLGGVDTSACVDRATVDLGNQLFEIIGTRKYDAGLARSRTVLELAAFDIQKYLE